MEKNSNPKDAFYHMTNPVSHYSGDLAANNDRHGSCESVPSELEDDFRTQMPPSEEKKWNRYALLVSGASLTLTIGMGIAGIVLATQNSNVALFGFALNCFMDVLSTAVVLWRFWPSQVNCSTAVLRQRERKASTIIAVLFVVVSFVIVGKSCVGLSKHEGPDNKISSLTIATTSFVVCLVLAAIKVRIGKAMHSASIATDGYNSLGGSVISLGVLISWMVFKHHAEIWYISFIVAIAVAVAMLVFGSQLLFRVLLRS